MFPLEIDAYEVKEEGIIAKLGSLQGYLNILSVDIFSAIYALFMKDFLLSTLTNKIIVIS